MILSQIRKTFKTCTFYHNVLVCLLIFKTAHLCKRVCKRDDYPCGSLLLCGTKSFNEESVIQVDDIDHEVYVDAEDLDVFIDSKFTFSKNTDSIHVTSKTNQRT